LGKVVLLVVQDIINQSGRYNGKKANVSFFDGNVKEGAEEDIVVEADRGRIMQVISNILYNAIRFTKEGDVNINMERKGGIIDSYNGKSNNNDDNNNKGEVIVSIKDTGAGIDPDVFPKLFSKFAVTSETGGNGLGLFISKNIVEAHGGRIWAANNANGKGATFYFTLPLSR
jgi:prepilin-type processing-associated H-X9-DG protein